MAYQSEEDVPEYRLHGIFLTTLVVLVLLAWGGVLIYLGLRFL